MHDCLTSSHYFDSCVNPRVKKENRKPLDIGLFRRKSFNTELILFSDIVTNCDCFSLAINPHNMAHSACKWENVGFPDLVFTKQRDQSIIYNQLPRDEVN